MPAKKPHFPPRAKSVISLFMSGGVSHVDTFDPKPALEQYAGQPLDGQGRRRRAAGPSRPADAEPVSVSRSTGSAGWTCPRSSRTSASHVDELALLRSVVQQVERSRAGALRAASGMIRMGFPSVGSWVTYGLGSETQILPAFVVIYDSRGGPFGGPANWSAGFMPAAYQGTVFRPSGDPIVDLKPPET